jgi:hypothetical protein
VATWIEGYRSFWQNNRKRSGNSPYLKF